MDNMNMDNMNGRARMDTEYLRGLLSKGGDVTFPAVNPSFGGNVYLISSPLALSSGCHVTLDGCTLRLADDVYSNIFISKGAWDDSPEKLTDIRITGRNGARLDGGKPNGLCEKTAGKNGLPHVLHNTFLLFRNVEGVSISNLRLSDPRYWCLTFYYCSDVRLSDLEFRASDSVPNQDGIDLRRGCHDVTVRNITGSTGDDTVALTALRYPNEDRFSIPGETDDIYNVNISNVSVDVTGCHGIIRLLCHDGIKIHDVAISDIYDRHMGGDRKNIAAVRLGDRNYWTHAQAAEGDMYNVTVKNVTTNSPNPVLIFRNIPGFRQQDVTV